MTWPGTILTIKIIKEIELAVPSKLSLPVNSFSVALAWGSLRQTRYSQARGKASTSGTGCLTSPFSLQPWLCARETTAAEYTEDIGAGAKIQVVLEVKPELSIHIMTKLFSIMFRYNCTVSEFWPLVLTEAQGLRTWCNQSWGITSGHTGTPSSTFVGYAIGLPGLKLQSSLDYFNKYVLVTKDSLKWGQKMSVCAFIRKFSLQVLLWRVCCSTFISLLLCSHLIGWSRHLAVAKWSLPSEITVLLLT